LLDELQEAVGEAPTEAIAENIRLTVRFIQSQLPEPDATGDYNRYVICYSD
jgi:hypothetical protein